MKWREYMSSWSLINPLKPESNAQSTLQKTEDVNDHPLFCMFLANNFSGYWFSRHQYIDYIWLSVPALNYYPGICLEDLTKQRETSVGIPAKIHTWYIYNETQKCYHLRQLAHLFLWPYLIQYYHAFTLDHFPLLVIHFAVISQTSYASTMQHGSFVHQ